MLFRCRRQKWIRVGHISSTAKRDNAKDNGKDNRVAKSRDTAFSLLTRPQWLIDSGSFNCYPAFGVDELDDSAIIHYVDGRIKLSSAA